MPDSDFPQKIQVLVVDSDPDSRDLLAALFNGYEARTIMAASASECLEKIQESPPDLLVCELALPDEDGYSLMGKVKAFEAAQGIRIPAITLTVYASDEDRSLALAAGFSRHLSKPLDIDEFLEAVTYALAQP
ncbi:MULTISPECIES: response regulator [unclassified Leptolyngbya]|uniref:response regulator n=1 Tax=unclassified Leptolyngbya TaxID=2650499 RepID=UPI0016884211|nr:response regulator [Leptolyngbya sp. FACHB-8]MBD2153544.1 response regulator [Leptolyngbya sp. FACHB-16]